MSLAIIPIDPAYMLLLGVLFGIAGLRNRGRAIGAGLVAVTLFGIVIPVYCYLRWPAWMWGYAIDPATVHPWVVVWAFALYYVCFVAGFALTPRRGGWLALAGVGLVNLALLVLVWPRYSKVGTYADFHSGRAADLMGSPLSTVLNVGFAVTVVGTLALWLWARRIPPAPAEGDQCISRSRSSITVR